MDEEDDNTFSASCDKNSTPKKRKIKQHQETKMHKCKTEAKKTSGVLDKFLTPTTRSEIEVSDREKITAAELALTYHTSDASNKKNIKLFPLVVQYFTAKNGIENKLIDFYENSNESADGMFQAIQESMALYQLPFHKISGLSADNTNSNFGVNHSLFTNMKELIPDLIKGNCHAHIVHNCMRHSMNFLSYDIENLSEEKI
ncbi:hypothetical protein MSG28_013609 [Choristoneura fumiferana]|uniref:Uncharacterized protein n=1 Tax=Choristoneura fumiferana TaxID=7141 RepID=A0ACC0K8S6_CHOFU|nr:hypothetical protein MSG28_013609 [Choristoneura fumiferana]